MFLVTAECRPNITKFLRPAKACARSKGPQHPNSSPPLTKAGKPSIISQHQRKPLQFSPFQNGGPACVATKRAVLLGGLGLDLG